MTPSLILRSGFIGTATGLLIVLIVLLWKKEPVSCYPNALLKAGVNGFLLGCVGCAVSFCAAQFLSERIQNGALLLGCVFGCRSPSAWYSVYVWKRHCGRGCSEIRSQRVAMLFNDNAPSGL